MKTKETENKKVKEIEVLSEEQIQALPDNVKKNVVALQKVMRDKELVQLNPLVTKLLDLKDRAEKIKLVVDEDGNITNECIEEYKAIKSDQRSYNGKLTKDAKKMKAPYIAASKGLKSIEDVLKGISNSIKDSVEKKFDKYEKELEKKKKEAIERRDKELLDSVAKANEEAEKQANINKVSQVFSDLTYTEIGENLNDQVMDNLYVFNKEALGALRNDVMSKTWETISLGKEINLLNEEQIDDIKSRLEKAKANGLRAIDQRLKDIAAQEELNRISKSSIPEPPQQNGIPPAPIKSVGPIPNNWRIVEKGNGVQSSESEDLTSAPKIGDGMMVDIKIATTEEFIKNVELRIEALEMATDLRIKEKITPELAALKTKFLKFKS